MGNPRIRGGRGQRDLIECNMQMYGDDSSERKGTNRDEFVTEFLYGLNMGLRGNGIKWAKGFQWLPDIIWYINFY
jgi:hypothetical protein